MTKQEQLISLLGDIQCNHDQYGYLTIDVQKRLKTILSALEAEIAKEKDEPKMSAEEVLQILDIDLYDHEIPNIVKAMMLYANQFKQ
jgi:hypothetical protein